MPDHKDELARARESAMRSNEIAKRVLLENFVLKSGVASHPSAVADLVSRLVSRYDLAPNTGEPDGYLKPNASALYREESPGQMTPAEMIEHIRASGKADHLFAEAGSRGNGGGSSQAEVAAMSPEEKMRIANERTKPAGY